MKRLTSTTLLLLLAACFPFGGPTRPLPGSYELERSEGGDIYWINGPDGARTGGGVLEGSVERLGWNDTYIIAYRHSTYRGDADGWMVIDVNSRSIAGPLTETELKNRRDLEEIQTLAVAEAWKRL
jgi:hypothetical protein